MPTKVGASPYSGCCSLQPRCMRLVSTGQAAEDFYSACAFIAHRQRSKFGPQTLIQSDFELPLMDLHHCSWTLWTLSLRTCTTTPSNVSSAKDTSFWSREQQEDKNAGLAVGGGNGTRAVALAFGGGCGARATDAMRAMEASISFCLASICSSLVFSKFSVPPSPSPSSAPHAPSWSFTFSWAMASSISTLS